MLNKYLDLIEKHPIRLAATIAVIGGLGSLPYMVFQGIPRTNQPQEQTQSQNQVGDLDNDGDDEPFDRTQCKVYNMGVALGAWVYQFKGIDGKLDNMLFTDDPDVIQTFDRSPFGIFWWSSSGFRGSDYAEIAKVLPPEGLKELDSLLDNYKYAAIGTSAFAKAVQESRNAGLLNTCDVD
ncbi:hypothetical protein LC608_16945 [Nostoc sp. XA010]|uniref:hypothetical protein n=1 Tax=Nostoc sp. XA010 TaxID=2780407 RepID=UPI001E30B1FA|nr:hypothetical protein [Nostoc sp. XA010]MCC5658643.1 hypothetical protein [Nostoc sp. XA010]